MSVSHGCVFSTRNSMWLSVSVLLLLLQGPMLLGSYSEISRQVRPIQTISCEECLDVSCENVTKVWQPLSDNGPVWSRDSLGNAIPECGFYTPPPGTWYHVCKKKHVFMVTNDSVAGLTFIFETPEQALGSERKTGEECPMLESELESDPLKIEFLTLEPEEADCYVTPVEPRNRLFLLVPLLAIPLLVVLACLLSFLCSGTDSNCLPRVV